jgi:hypothetical protein
MELRILPMAASYRQADNHSLTRRWRRRSATRFPAGMASAASSTAAAWRSTPMSLLARSLFAGSDGGAEHWAVSDRNIYGLFR